MPQPHVEHPDQPARRRPLRRTENGELAEHEGGSVLRRPQALHQEPTEEGLARAAGIDLSALRSVTTVHFEPHRYALQEAAVACLGFGDVKDAEAALAALEP
eukprot:5415655-Prymnesium_polylepis.1